MKCPECGGVVIEAHDEHFPECEDCGFTILSEEAKAVREEAEREYKQAKQECWPDPVPSYREWIERGK